MKGNFRKSRLKKKKLLVEFIDDSSKLFYWIHKSYIDNDETDIKLKIKPAAFNPKPEPHSQEMSVMWDRYCSAIEARNKNAKPENIGILSFLTLDIRNNPILLSVTHQPTSNKSHSIIHDVLPSKTDPEIRLKLRRACSWEIYI